MLMVTTSGTASEHHTPQSPSHYMPKLVDEEWYPRTNLRDVKGCPQKVSKVRNWSLCLKEHQGGLSEGPTRSDHFRLHVGEVFPM